MEFLNNYKQRKEAFRIKNIERESVTRYNIAEFNGSLYYTFDSVPIIGITPETPVREMLEHLHRLRENFSAYKKSFATSSSIL